MSERVYISNVGYIPTKIKGFYKLRFNLFKHNEKRAKMNFDTSAMTLYNAKKYLTEAENIQGATFNQMFSLNPQIYHTINDDKTGEIVGLYNEQIKMSKNDVCAMSKNLQSTKELER